MSLRHLPSNHIQTDALFTPRSATDDNGQEVWRWTSDAFGVVDPDTDFGTAPATDINLRFPGQYFDIKTGLHYNWHRYYQPWTGRYLSSDPIGLRGGLNGFGYANATPTTWVDPTGNVKSKNPGGLYRLVDCRIEVLQDCELHCANRGALRLVKKPEDVDPA